MADRPDSRAMRRPAKARGWASTVSRHLRTDLAFGALSSVAAGYLRTVWATGRLICEPTPPDVLFDAHAPLIATTWHGHAFLLPLLRPTPHPVDVLVSRTGDGEIIGRTLEKLGCGTVRGSGTINPARMFEKGAVAGFRALKSALDQGHSVLMTADYQRQAHRASPGLVALARLSRRPVVPLVVVTSGRFGLGSWDRAELNLPFSRIAFVYADPIFVPPRADEATLEEKRLEVERSLKAVTDRAHEIADRTRG